MQFLKDLQARMSESVVLTRGDVSLIYLSIALIWLDRFLF